MTTETKANPLIDENGDTSKVSAVLDFVVWAAYGDDGSATMGAGPMFGLGAILETCSAALKEMA